MDGLQSITQFKTGSTIANGMELNAIAVNKYKTSIEGLSLSQAKTALSTTALNEIQKEQILTSAGLLKTTESLTLSEVKEMASSMSLSAQKKEEILTTLQGAYSENEWNKERLEAIVLESGEAGAIAEVILAKKLEDAENVKGIAGRKALTASLWEELKARLAIMATNPVAWIVGIVGAGIGLVALQKKLTKSLDECVEELDEYNSAFESAQNEIKSLDTELDTCTDRIEELQKLAENGTISIIEQEELDRLKDTNEELDRNLRIQKEKAQLSAIEGAKSADETLSKTVESKYITSLQDFSGVGVATEYTSWVSPEKELEAAISEYNRLSTEIDKLNESYDDGTISANDYEKQLSDLTTQQTNARTRASEMSDILVSAEQAYKNLENTDGKLTTTQSNNLKTVENANIMYTEFLGTINDVKDASKELNANTTSQNPDEITVSNIFGLEDADDTLTTLGKISESIDTIQNAYKTLSSAIDEYNETGSFSIDTLQSVIELGDDWLDYLIDEEGKLKLDKEALQKLTASRLEDMKMQTINNIIDNVSKIQTDADATLYLASTNYALAESYKDVAENAIEAAKAQMELAVVAGTLSQENYEASASKMDADIEKVYKLFDNTDFISDISLGGGSGSKSKSDFKETVDFFERRIDILNDTISRLKSNLENVTGSFAKNNLIDAQSTIYQEELRNYTDALAMYQKKANEVLTTLPDDIAEKVKNGAIDLTTFVGASSEAVVDAINEYEQWAEKVDDCNLQLIELQKTLSDLELEKFNNVVNNFSSQFDLRDNVITNIDKHIALLEEQGQLIGASFYGEQIQQSQKQLALLEQEKIQLVEQMNSALAFGNVKTGSEAWLEMVGVLSDVEGQITDCKKSIEEFSNEILELNWKSFERVQDTFSDLNTELENFVGLLDDIDVADDKGNWSTEAKTKLGLLSQQYELAVYQVGEYKSAIEKLKKQYTNGDYSAIEFSEKLAELSDGMWDATNSAEDLRDAIVDLNEQRVEVQIEGIEKEISAYEELVDEQIKLIEETDNLIKKRDDLAEKSKSVTDLERQIASMMHDDSQATVAKRLKLEEELAEARKDLADTEREYSVDSQKTALEKQLEEYTNERNAEIEALEKSLENKEQLIADSFNVVKQNANLIGQQIAQIATEHGIIVSDSLISSWAQGENAIASYGTMLSDKSSAFIGNVMDVEGKVWDLQSQANNTSTSLAGMFSTQADNLVSELSQSYYAEGNVLNMTNALHDSLVNTLESGYDVSSITSALKSIEDSAKSAADEIRGLGDLDVSVDNTNTERYRLVDKMTGKPYKENLTYAEAVKLQEEDKQVARHTTIERYVSGTRNSKGNIIITDEEGQELKLPKLSSGNYTIANEGTQILTKAQTDNIFEWSKLHPIDMIPWSVRSSMQNVVNNFPQVATRNVSQPITIENKVIFTGAVNDTNNFAKQIAQIADKQITKSWKEFTSELHK